jgi:lipopolysaccharide transport system ATP-binding protein
VHLTDLKVLQGESETLNLTAGQPVTFSFRVEGEMRWGVSCRFTIVDSLGHPILGFDSSNLAPADDFTTTGSRFECELEGLPLVPGRYRLDIGVFGSGHAQDVIEGATFFEVEPGLLGGRPMTVSSDGARVAVAHRWTSPAGASGEGPPRLR